MRAPRLLRRSTIVTLGLLAACGAGVRPTLAAPGALGGEVGTPTGVGAADSVLQSLEAGGVPELTASYTINTKFGNTTTDATVVRSGDRLSVTIGDIRFLRDGGTRTCRLSTGACETGVKEAWVSDTAVTSGFYAPSPARQLRVSLSRRSGEPTGSAATVAGRPASCVTVPIGGGHELTCAASEGVLARLDNASVDVQLTSLTDSVDPVAFQRSP